MRQTRDDRRNAKLQQLSTMMGIADRFGPGRQTAEQLQVENLRGMQQERQQRQALLPFMLEQQQMQNDTAQQSLQFAQQQQPLQLQQIQEAINAMGLDRQFAEQTMQDRIAEQAARSQGVQAESQFARETLPARKEVAMMEPQAKGLAMNRDSAAITSQRIVDDANRQQMTQQRESFPLQVQFDQARIREKELSNEATVRSNNAIPGNNPIAQLPPELQTALNIDKKLQAGIRPTLETMEARRQLESDLGALVGQMRTNPSVQWSQQANNIRTYFDNGGVPLSPSTLPTPQELDQLLGPVRGTLPPEQQMLLMEAAQRWLKQ